MATSKAYVHPDDIWDAIVDVEVVGSDMGLEEFVYGIEEAYGGEKGTLRDFVYNMCVAIACTVNAAHPECKGLWD